MKVGDRLIAINETSYTNDKDAIRKLIGSKNENMVKLTLARPSSGKLIIFCTCPAHQLYQHVLLRFKSFNHSYVSDPVYRKFNSSCKDGFHPITTNLEECEEAAAYLNASRSVRYVIAGKSSLPGGCFSMKGYQALYFHPNVGGGDAHDYTMFCRTSK